jgi:hypothetical protein
MEEINDPLGRLVRARPDSGRARTTNAAVEGTLSQQRRTLSAARACPPSNPPGADRQRRRRGRCARPAAARSPAAPSAPPCHCGEAYCVRRCGDSTGRTPSLLLLPPPGATGPGGRPLVPLARPPAHRRPLGKQNLGPGPYAASRCRAGAGAGAGRGIRVSGGTMDHGPAGTAPGP